MFNRKYSLMQHPTWSFYVNRAARLLPVFVSVSLLGILAITMQAAPFPIDKLADTAWLVRTLTPLGNSSLLDRLIEPAWSLDIEIQFYFLFPLIYVAVSRRSVRLSAFIVGIIVLTSLVFGLRNSLLAYAPYFLVGIAISRMNWVASSRTVTASFLGMGTFLLAVLTSEPSKQALFENTQTITYGVNLLRFPDAVLATLAIPFVSQNVRIDESSIGRHAGNLSYPVYLVHWILLYPYVQYAGSLSMRERAPYFVIYLASTFIVSLVIYIAVDRPCESFRRKRSFRSLKVSP